MVELNAAIWSKLPLDLILSIIEQSDKVTQVNWSRTSRKLHPFASSGIWGQLRVTGSHFDAYTHFENSVFPTIKRNHILHFLIKEAYLPDPTLVFKIWRSLAAPPHAPNSRMSKSVARVSQLTGPLPGALVKFLDINNLFERSQEKCSRTRPALYCLHRYQH